MTGDKPSPAPEDEIPPSVMAMSNLRCPSPPPILTNSDRNSTVSPPAISLKLADNVTHENNHANLGLSLGLNLGQSHPDDSRPTIPSGGALLQEKEKEKISDRSSAEKEKDINNYINNVHLPIDSPVSNTSTTSLDYISNPPKDSIHHKVPSVHAHFYVDETVKPKVNRSRSGSEATSELLNSIGNLTNTSPHSKSKPNSVASKNIGSLEKLAGNASSPNLNNHLSEQNANIDPRLPQDDGKIHVLLGVCGALSAPKVKFIILKLLEIYGADKVSIQLILTKSSEQFISPEILNYLETVRNIRIWKDQDEWTTWRSRADPVLHIELRRWADIFIVCPLTANTLSKISLGLCDNLLTNVIRAWNTSYPMLLAPCMVSYSYNAVTTKRQLRLLLEEMPWIEILKPVEKVVGSYGDIGMGGMMDYNEIVNKIVLKLGGYPEEEDEDEDEPRKIDETLVEDEDDEDDDDDDDDEDEEEEEEEEKEPHQDKVVETMRQIESMRVASP